MQPLQESNLKDEVVEIQKMLTAMLEENQNVSISPRTYSRHMAVMYLIIECMKHEIFTEAKATGEFRGWWRLEQWMKGLDL